MRIASFVCAAALALLAAPGMESAGIAGDEGATRSGVAGKIRVEGKGTPEGAFVYAYDSAQNDLRQPGKLVSSPSSTDGSYTLALEPGTYYLVARKRASGSPRGYLAAGDFEGQFPGNPVTVKAGETLPVDIAIKTLPGKFLLAPYTQVKGDMGITGKVLGKDGKPFAGAYVMVYTRKDRIGRPAFLAGPTNQDGEYAVYPNAPGTYYVAARGDYGDLPKKGEPYGTYDANPDHKVEVRGKTVLEGVDITMNRFTRDLTKCAEH